MITHRSIINALIIAAAVLVAPYFISELLQYNYLPLLFVGTVVTLGLAFFVAKNTLCVWPMLSLSIASTLNFLPVHLQVSQVLCFILIFYYLISYVIIRQEKFKIGKASFFWPILILFLIVLYHNHSIHLNSLGSTETEGGKPAFFVYVAVLAYFCGINVSPPTIPFLSRVPLYFTILCFLSGLPFALTTFIPGLAPYLYLITDNVNIEAYSISQSTTDESGEINFSRAGAFGGLGVAIALYLFSFYPIGTWIRPGRWWVAFLWLIALVLVVLSGYRNELFSFFLIPVVATFCHYSWRSVFFLLMFICMTLIIFAASSNNFIRFPLSKLPVIAQRTMSFLPGDWDEDALRSAESSNAFRTNIQDVYIEEYMKKSPLFGNGFEIDKIAFDEYRHLSQTNQGDAKYLEAKIFIEGKMPHTGWISVYDIVGIIGTGAFVLVGVNQIVVAGQLVFGRKTDRTSALFPLYVWLTCSLVNIVVGFFAVFGDFGTAFRVLCVYAIVLSQLCDIRRIQASDRPPNTS